MIAFVPFTFCICLNSLKSILNFYSLITSPQKRSERAQESDESGPSSGIIKSIKLWNFMCHDYLMYNVSGHVNFITGRNGSGKSAILSGLIIGLGGKSSITSRGSSLKNFVKKGRRSAIIEITLNNADSDAYKREEYGSYIVVRRKISIDSQSTYTIKGKAHIWFRL